MNEVGARVALPGLPVFGGSHAITNACPRHWQGCISSPSLSCWLAASFNLFNSSIRRRADVHNRL